jgi:hypothetical protein
VPSIVRMVIWTSRALPCLYVLRVLALSLPIEIRHPVARSRGGGCHLPMPLRASQLNSTSSVGSIDAPFRNVMTSCEVPPLKLTCQRVASTLVKVASEP